MRLDHTVVDKKHKFLGGGPQKINKPITLLGRSYVVLLDKPDHCLTDGSGYSPQATRQYYVDLGDT